MATKEGIVTGRSRQHPGKKGAQHDDIDNRGDIALSESALWGDQTRRSLAHFDIGKHRFDHSFIKALVHIKRACALVNREAGLLDGKLCEAILSGCDDILAGHHSEQFPLSVWQTGSGTQTNMNVNEVISSLANTYLKQQFHRDQDDQSIVHPNDHVNMSQSTNDTFPSAMHIVVAQLTRDTLFASLEKLDVALAQKQIEFETVYMVGRTHLMDAMPLTVGAVLSAFRAQLSDAKSAIAESVLKVYRLAVGGTAVGSGSNAPPAFGKDVCVILEEHYALPFSSHSNLYAAVSGEDSLLRYSASLKQLTGVLFKMANDFRFLASGPRCGLNEWKLPANEPGSSMMPGKVNPTQCEALSMVCLQVFGNDLTVSLSASHGQLQLNTYRPVIIHNVLESIELLSDAMQSFALNCVEGLTLNSDQINANLAANLSVITVLAPKLGYELAARIVHEADAKVISLAAAAESLGVCSQIQFKAMLEAELKAIAADSNRDSEN